MQTRLRLKGREREEELKAYSPLVCALSQPFIVQETKLDDQNSGYNIKLVISIGSDRRLWI